MSTAVTPITDVTKKISTDDQSGNQLPCLGTVTQINKLGKISAITFLADPVITHPNDSSASEMPITAQAKHISTADFGDIVLVQNTQQGLVVMALLSGENEAPAAHIVNNQGNVVVNGAKSVSLTTEKGSISVFSSGKVLLEGQEIEASSESNFSLSGWPLRLN